MDPTHPTLRRLLRGDNRGQAIVEFTLFAMVLVLLFCGLIDFSRIIRDRLILINLSREGSNLASRGASMTNALTDVINDAYPLNMNNGRVIISSVFNSNGTYIVTAQVTGGGLSGVSSRIGSVGGRATLPATSVPLPQLNQYLYVTEVWWPFAPLTPIGTLLGWTVPSVLYDAAYF